MAKNRFSQQARDSVLGQIIDKEISGNKKILNAIDFLESESGPRVDLYPAQRFIYKILFGVPLDYKEKIIPVWDGMHETLRFELKETDYLKFLNDEGRCNYSDWRDLPLEGFQEAALFVGRRGGKSQLVAACADYKMYRLLSIRSPHELYGLVEGSPIEFTFLAQDDGGANRLYAKFKSDVNGCPFFTPYLRKTPGSKNMEFVTEVDLDKRDVIPSIKVGAYACTTNAVRGPSSYFLALDEFCHFRNERGSNSNDVYEAATPATMNFINKDSHKLESLTLTISSPWKKEGKGYELWQTGMQDPKGSGLFVYRASTAEFNPKTSKDYLRKKLKTASLTFKAEYLGEWLDSSETYVTSLAIDSAVDGDRENSLIFTEANLGRMYFWGVDLGFKNDATAIAICHWEANEDGNAILVYDYIDRLMVGEGIYKDHSELPVDDIFELMLKLNEVYPGTAGMTDQYAGSMFVQKIKQYGLEFMELLPLSAGINSQMYYILKGYLDQKAIRFPNVPKFIKEIKSVEATFIDKHRIKVNAPNEKDAHDDMCDAVAEAAWLAQRWLVEEGHKYLNASGDLIFEDPSQMNITINQEILDEMPLSILKQMDRQKRLEMSISHSNAGMISPRLRGRR